MVRLLAGCALGAGVAALSAVVLGDYPLSGSVPWVAAILVPALVGIAMTSVAGRYRSALWAATGILSAAGIAWGVAIATGWGLDPVPGSAWAAIVIALVWPPALAVTRTARRTTTPTTP